MVEWKEGQKREKEDKGEGRKEIRGRERAQRGRGRESGITLLYC